MTQAVGTQSQLLAKASARIGTVPYEVAIQVGRHFIVADEPKALGGRDAGPPPFGLLLAALGACTSATLKMYAERKSWPLSALEVKLRLHRSPDDGAQSIERVLIPEGVSIEQAERLADIAERTPVTLAIKAGVTIQTRLSGSET